MIENGTFVEVTEAYRGGGHFAPDGNEGRYTVVGHLPASSGGVGDYYLARGWDRRNEKCDWALICHPSRIKVKGEA